MKKISRNSLFWKNFCAVIEPFYYYFLTLNISLSFVRCNCRHINSCCDTHLSSWCSGWMASIQKNTKTVSGFKHSISMLLWLCFQKLELFLCGIVSDLAQSWLSLEKFFAYTVHVKCTLNVHYTFVCLLVILIKIVFCSGNKILLGTAD